MPLAERLTQITRSLLAEPEHESTLDRVVRLAVGSIPAVGECSVVLRRPDGSIDTPAATSAMILELDDLQDELRQGPCAEAVWSMDTWVINDMTAEARWPGWTARAFDHTDVAVASIFARHTAYALAVVDQTEQSSMALLSRQTIGAAQGMLMQRYGLNLTSRSRCCAGTPRRATSSCVTLPSTWSSNGFGDDRPGGADPGPYTGLPGHPFHAAGG